MILQTDIDAFSHKLKTYDLHPHPDSRVLALYSAAITVADDGLLDAVIDMGLRINVSRETFYEIVLQSYLFLGFPRMLNAADHLEKRLPCNNSESMLVPISTDESQTWFNRGVDLCRKVYSGNYELLKNRVESFAPDIFRWMVFEGYGKVLSRPGLDPVDRELAIVACLMVEDRQKQLSSHIRGALNVDAKRILIEEVINDVAPLAPEGHQSALAILEHLGKK